MNFRLCYSAVAALIAAGGALAESIPSTTGGTNVKLEINGVGQTSIHSAIDYTLGAGEMNFRLAEPGACFDFGAQQQGVSLSMTDLNNNSAGSNLYGLTAIDFDSIGGMLTLATNEFLRCFVTDAAGDYVLAPEGQAVGGGELLFADGFEESGFGVGEIDLQVEFLDPPPTSMVAGQTTGYSILVSNVGSEAADNVAFQDTYPADNSLFDAVLSDGAWTCTAAGGADCGALFSSTGPIRVQDLSLPAGASVEYEISGRALFDIPAPAPGTVMTIAAGAVAGDGADFDPSDNTAQTAVTVIAAPAALAINPASHDFGPVGVDDSVSRVFEISNAGDAATDLTLDTLGVTSASEAFAIQAAGTTCQAGTVLPGGDTCNVEVLFSPGVAGPDNGELDVTSDAGDVTAALDGEGVVADLVGDVTGLDFGNVILGAPEVMSVELSNGDTTGATELVLTDLEILIGDVDAFEILPSSTCQVGTMLSGLSTCQVDVEFDPDATAGYTAGLTISSDVAGNHDVLLQGQGVEPLLELTPSGLIFGDVIVGQTSAPMSIELSNPGTFDLTVTSVSTPGNPAFAEVGGTCPGGSFVIAPADSCTIEYTFTPSATGGASSSVQINSIALSSPDNFGLLGNGVDD